MVDLWGPIQAILAIPSALQAIRDLSQGGNNELEKQISAIEVSPKDIFRDRRVVCRSQRISRAVDTSSLRHGRTYRSGCATET